MPVFKSRTSSAQMARASPSSRFYRASLWKWELLTWLLGTGAIASILLILVFYSDHSVKSFRFPFQLSTVIAALSQVAQASLLVSVSGSISQQKWIWFKKKKRRVIDLKRFDDASRGPDGCLSLFFKLPGVHLVQLGAIATILMLLLSPFVQQSLDTKVRDRISTDPSLQASLRRTTSYSLFDSYGDYGPDACSNPAATCQSSTGVSGIIMTPNMQAAIQSGMITRNVEVENIPATCPTGNCVFEPYTTLAFCSSVEDISSQVQMLCPNNTTTCSIKLPTVPSPTYFHNTTSSTGTKQTKYANIPLDGSAGSSVIGSYTTLWFATVAPLAGILNAFSGEPPPTANFYGPSTLLFETYLAFSKNLSISVEKQQFQALKGNITLCVRSLQTTVSSNITSTVLVSQTNIDNISLLGPYDSNNEKSQLCAKVPGDETTYCIDSQTMNNIRFYAAKSQFYGSASLLNPAGGDDYVYSTTARDIVADIYGDSGLIGKMSGFTARMESVAISMTNQLRKHQNSTEVLGAAVVSEQYFKVTFPWLIMPSVIWLLVTAFFWITVIQGSTTNAPMWKSSVVTLLDCSAPGGQANSYHGVEAQSKDFHAHLENNDGMWRLVRSSSSERSSVDEEHKMAQNYPLLPTPPPPPNRNGRGYDLAAQQQRPDGLGIDVFEAAHARSQNSPPRSR